MRALADKPRRQTPGGLRAHRARTNGRRTYPRVHGPFEGSWHDLSGNHAGRIYALSARGCFIEAPGHDAPGKQVRVQIQLPQVGLISVRGVVMTEQPRRGFSVRFVYVLTEKRDFLIRAVEHLLGAGSPG